MKQTADRKFCVVRSIEPQGGNNMPKRGKKYQDSCKSLFDRTELLRC